MRFALASLPTAAAFALFLVSACGPSGGPAGASSDGGSDPGKNDDSDACSSAASCTGSEICHPDTNECTANVACDDHAICGVAGHCGDDGVCEPNVTGGTCEKDISCPRGETCVGGYCGCEGVAAQAEPVTPNVLIVLDRSDSMDNEIGNQSKWDIARDALSQILSTYGDRVRFGLVMYASDNSCGPGQVDVDIADGSAATILQTIQQTSADSKTPIGNTLDALVGYQGLADPTRPNYILLLTDGEENCNGDGESAVRALGAQTPEVKTFVVGFGSGVDDGALSAMAEAGGTALPASPSYYQADDAQQLTTAFDSILGSVLSCTYALSGEPTDPDSLFVYFDGTAVERDPSQTNGWDYDASANQVTFYGAACDSLQSGSVTDLAIVFGCPADSID